ncbi:MAG: hypothetical protein HC888_14690 [Candidatus Competibacteraceae bacterium]|nr:hypothetical protein [Candidatus Competibacteraceae bacterium]
MGFDCKHGAALALEYLANTSILKEQADAFSTRSGATGGAAYSGTATGGTATGSSETGSSARSGAALGGSASRSNSARQNPALSISMTDLGSPAINSMQQAKETEVFVQTLNPPLARLLDHIAGASAAKRDSNQKQQIVYVLKSNGTEIRVQPLKAAIKKDGGCGRASELNLYKLSSRHTMPDYVSNTDLSIFQLLQFFIPAFDYGRDDFLIDCQNRELAKSTVKKLIDTGRCFYEDDLEKPLKHGTDIELEPVWRQTQNKYQLKLQFAANVDVAKTECVTALSALHYYDHRANEIGLWSNKFDEEMLNELFVIGPISREQLLSFQVNATVRGLADKIPIAPEECRFATVKKKKELTLSLVPSPGVSQKNEPQKDNL